MGCEDKQKWKRWWCSSEVKWTDLVWWVILDCSVLWQELADFKVSVELLIVYCLASSVSSNVCSGPRSMSMWRDWEIPLKQMVTGNSKRGLENTVELFTCNSAATGGLSLLAEQGMIQENDPSDRKVFFKFQARKHLSLSSWVSQDHPICIGFCGGSCEECEELELETASRAGKVLGKWIWERTNYKFQL